MPISLRVVASAARSPAAAGGFECVAEDGEAFGEVAATVKVTEEGGGQPGGVAGPAVVGGVPGDRDQGGAFASSHSRAAAGSGSGGTGVVGGGMRGRRWRSAGYKCPSPPRRCAGSGRTGGSAPRAAPPRLQGGGQLAGVAAEQVVHAVPARCRRAGSGGRGPARPVPGGPAARSSPVRAATAYGSKSAPGCSAEQPEGPGGVGVEVAAGPGEHGPHSGVRVPAGLEQVQPVRRSASSPASSASGTAGRLAASSAATRKASGSRQHWAASSAAAVGVGVHPCPDQRPQQRDRVLQRQHVQVQRGPHRPGPPARPAHPGW